MGCVLSLRSVLFELAEESEGIKAFQILKNIHVDTLDYFTPFKGWDVIYFNCYDSEVHFDTGELYAFSVVGTKSKNIVFDYFKKRIKMNDRQFINLIHPTSYISRSVKLNYGLQLEPQSLIAAYSSIGFGVNIKKSCNIGHHCLIGPFITINPGATLSSFVTIKCNSMIGSGSTIKDDIIVGSNTIIGAGSVVVKDIPDNCIAFGNPCEVKRYI